MGKDKAAILALVGCCSYMFVIGCLYLWGNISLYITSYFRLMKWNVYESDLVFYVVIRALVMLVLVPYSAFWVQQYGTNKLLIIGSIFFIAFCFPSSLTTNPYIFSIFYGLAFGISAGFGYTSVISCILKHFKRKGLATGIGVCAYGLGAFFFAPISRWIINPNNLMPNIKVQHGNILETYYGPEVALGVPKMIRYLCLIWFVLLLISSFFARDKDSNTENTQTNINTIEMIEKTNNKEESLNINFQDIIINREYPDLKTALKSTQFWIMFYLFVEIIYLDFFMAFAYKTIGVLYNFDDSFLTVIGSFFSVCNGLSRIFWGFLADKFLFKVLYSVTLVSKAILLLTLFSIASSKFLYFLWVILIVFFIAPCLVLFPLMCNKLYGDEIGNKIYSFMFAGITFSSMLVYFGNSLILPILNYSGYLKMFAIFSVIGLILLYFLDTNPKWKRSNEQ